MENQLILTADMSPPTDKKNRETLRENGQFWTPDWIADPMAAYALRNGSSTLFDPGVGAGSLFRAGRRLKGLGLKLRGREIDPLALKAAENSGLTTKDLSEIELKDFVLHPPYEKYLSIVSNPPYVRHHRLPKSSKIILHTFARNLIGNSIDGRAGLHVFFFLHCLNILAPGGRLAFIVSSDICEGIFAQTLWSWVISKFCLDAIVMFAPNASPFPNIDTNAMLILIRNSPPQKHFTWARLTKSHGNSLLRWVELNTPINANIPDIEITQRTLEEGYSTGFSRPPNKTQATKYRLGDFARVTRGIASGQNDFFFMTAEKARELKIPDEYFVRAVGRTRDIINKSFTKEDLCRLEASNRPTHLLSIDENESQENFPDGLAHYLKIGEENGISKLPLISTRNPWYRTEKRMPPPFFFSYLGRGNIRFIRNYTDAVPLSCFLCIYPFDLSSDNIEWLWSIFSDTRTLENLRLVGKAYGNGSLKVEPRALQQLQLPDDFFLGENANRFIPF